ncbi:hypothetical protein [Salinicola endophyticus]|uniref:Uncharacterized protein n=1 Tax=Salinicola endophyticus TaxID=1949083 RepID=A0AB74UGX3_9GAMM
MCARDGAVYHRFFVRPRYGQRHVVEQLILAFTERQVQARGAPDGSLLKPTILKAGQGRYLVPMRWCSGEVITIDDATSAIWFWLDADIPFNGSLAQRLAHALTQHPGVECVAEDNTRGAGYVGAEAWIIDDDHYLLQGVNVSD